MVGMVNDEDMSWFYGSPRGGGGGSLVGKWKGIAAGPRGRALSDGKIFFALTSGV